jgi:hypothetical protein
VIAVRTLGCEINEGDISAGATAGSWILSGVDAPDEPRLGLPRCDMASVSVGDRLRGLPA